MKTKIDNYFVFGIRHQLLVFLLFGFNFNLVVGQSEVSSKDTILYQKVNHALANFNILTFNIGLNRFDAYILQGGQEWANVNPNTWWRNLKSKPEWDRDLYSTNWFGHPYQGSIYHLSARSSGANFMQATGYVLGGTFLWEYFGESHPPSANDFVTTVIGGYHLGEILYQISEQALQGSRSSKVKKYIHRPIGALLNPVGTFDKLLFNNRSSAKTKSKQFTFSYKVGGTYRNSEFQNQYTSITPYIEANIKGIKTEKTLSPFDHFLLKTWLQMDKSTSENDDSHMRYTPFLNINTYANLFAKVQSEGSSKRILGIYQDYDFFNNNDYSLSSIALLGSYFDCRDIGTGHFSYDLRVGSILLGAADSETYFWKDLPDDIHNKRDYNMGSGFKISSSVGLAKSQVGTINLKYDFWKIYILSGPSGNEYAYQFVIDYMLLLSDRIGLAMSYRYFEKKGSYDQHNGNNPNYPFEYSDPSNEKYTSQMKVSECKLLIQFLF